MKKEDIDEKELQNEAKDDNSELQGDEEAAQSEEEVNEEGADETEENENEGKEIDELAEAKDKYLRLYSEFDNYRRRTAKEKLELIQTAGERIMVEMLPVLLLLL